MKSNRTAVSLVVVSAAVGALFAGTSTYDFIQHLDRQVHAITCTYVPGLGAADASGASGCFAVMMSPYAAVWRTSTWGGIPIALPALAVFIYLAFKAIDVLWRRREDDPAETRYLLAATALPLLTSIAYFFISVLVVGVVCKLCAGVYVASVAAFVAALVAHRRTPAPQGALPWGRDLGQFAVGVAFVAVPVLLYLGLKPDVRGELGRCGKLLRPQDTYSTRVKLHSAEGGTPAIEVLDPLCPACKGVHDRLHATGLMDGIDLEAALFPLDKECNWMLGESVHPGACAVSEAVLCAGARANDVVTWAFDHQSELREAAAKEPASVRVKVTQAFPDLAGCVDRPEVKARLNKALRWTVANSLPISTPQLYVRGNRLCDEDTDLGLEYTLTQVIGPMAAATPQKPAGGSRKSAPTPPPLPSPQGVAEPDAALAPPAPAADAVPPGGEPAAEPTAAPAGAGEPAAKPAEEKLPPPADNAAAAPSDDQQPGGGETNPGAAGHEVTP
ncbi:MAG: hypothetical protein HY903_09245 [Deltaproteobacteria bacterium]|nr:hypothetical protein [Deltaproteobacteria bacterium]